LFFNGFPMYLIHFFAVAHVLGDGEDPYPSLSDFHDYEPQLEFDDTELQQPSETGGRLEFANDRHNILKNNFLNSTYSS